MTQSPWADHLARAQSPVSQAVASVPPRATAPAQSARHPDARPEAAIQQAPVSGALRELLDERAALEQRMRKIAQGGPAPGDPRYQVMPMAERRAELAAWAEARDRRAEPLDHAATAGSANSEPGMRPAKVETNAGAPEPPIRSSRQASTTQPAIGTPSPYARQPDINAVLDRRLNRALDKTGMDTAYARMDERIRAALERAPTRAGATSETGDAVARRWHRDAPDALPASMDPYQRASEKMLKVPMGSIDEIGRRLDGLRDLARERRQEDAAEQQRDQTRRDRALRRRRAQRQEEESRHG